MKRSVSRLACAVALAAATLLPSASAWADEEGGSGRIVSLTINTQGSDKYASFHGSLGVRSGSGRRDIYFWGGSTCPAQKLDASEVSLLAGALNRKINIKPVYRTGEGARGTRCLVGFELSA